MIIVPESIANAARSRVRKSQIEREQVMKAIQSGSPLDAEPNMNRTVSRIQAVTGVDFEQAKRLAHNEDPTKIGLTGDARLGAERLQGKTNDFVGISFLELARAAASTVGRIVLQDLQPVGSGFAISDQLFLTNNHVIPSISEARRCLIEFNYELDTNMRPRGVVRFELAPEAFFLTNAENQLDFTIVAIGRRISGMGELADFGYCPLLATNDKHILGEFVNIIQHPEGDYKQVVLRENRLVTRLDTVLHYMADTQPGSSGSPVFNDQWEVIALHHWGEPFLETTLSDRQPLQKEVNEGIRISAIARSLEAQKNNLNRTEQALIDAVLNPPYRHPSNIQEKIQLSSSTQPETAMNNNYSSSTNPSSTAVTWTIPLEITVRLGQITSPNNDHLVESSPSEDTSTASEAIRIDTNYTNRNGYNPNFLPGFRVDLPELTSRQEKQAAKVKNADAEDNPFELKYQHFSIIMNAERRMAFVTAVNIDGATRVEINRKTGEPSEGGEASEVWFLDPRIDEDEQSNQSLYSKQTPKRVFDRGHLVRRQDPTWGTAQRAKRANADTFHFTNCTPQESKFNQSGEIWQGIENYVLDNARAEREKVTVFTGPVFTDDDPEYRFVQIPRKFWKILVRVENEQLLATALIADQSDLIQRLPERFSESFNDLSNVTEYQTSIREIENLTDLDFGSLRDYDTFRTGSGESIISQRRINRFEDIILDSSSSSLSKKRRR